MKSKKYNKLLSAESFTSTEEDKDKDQTSRYGSGSPTMHSSYSESIGAGVGGGSASAPTSGATTPVTVPGGPEIEAARPSTAGEEELQLQLALAMSKEEHDEDVKRRKADEIKYQLAIEESKKEQDDEDVPVNKNSLLDLAQGGLDPWAPPPVVADPWGAPAASKPPPTQTDPWGAAPAQIPLTSANNDPWSTPNTNGANTPMQNAGPWGGGIGDAPNSQSASPWSSPAANTGGTHTTNNGTAPPGGIDDEFDLLSSTRTKSPTNISSQNDLANDLLGNMGGAGGGQADPWNMSNMSSSLHDRPISKSPADFLGDNANLVNLDNLVTKPAPTDTMNPFAMTITTPASNPFQHTVPPRVPMNQMHTSTSMGFEQTGSTLLPAPLAPGGGPPPMATPIQQPIQPQGYNPFL